MIYASEVYVSALIGQPQIPRQPCHWLLLLIAVIVWEYQETMNTEYSILVKTLVGVSRNEEY